MPDFSYEQSAISKGYTCIVGLDEVGRGCLAGPLVAGAVVLETKEPQWIVGVDDSKKISPTKREKLSEAIKLNAKAWSIGLVQPADLDKWGLTKSTENAMKHAILGLGLEPDYLLLDYVPLDSWEQPHDVIKQGDSKSYSIAAASIIAKVYRDNLMVQIASKYPRYDFASNKGYGSKAHMNALSLYGPCDIHRQSFTPVQEVSGKSYIERT
tara:strand:- start:9584 stop:10216 length:633 start_codon:yes stop_codon:yes gene_type:complete